MLFNFDFRRIDEAVKFPGLETIPNCSYANKQLVSREIELEQLRRRMHQAESCNVTEEIDQFDENKKNISTPKSSKG